MPHRFTLTNWKGTFITYILACMGDQVEFWENMVINDGDCFAIGSKHHCEFEYRCMDGWMDVSQTLFLTVANCSSLSDLNYYSFKRCSSPTLSLEIWIYEESQYLALETLFFIFATLCQRTCVFFFLHFFCIFFARCIYFELLCWSVIDTVILQWNNTSIYKYSCEIPHNFTI